MIIAAEEHAALVRAARLRDEVIRVDDFPPDLSLAAERASGGAAGGSLMRAEAALESDLLTHRLDRSRLSLLGACAGGLEDYEATKPNEPQFEVDRTPPRNACERRSARAASASAARA